MKVTEVSVYPQPSNGVFQGWASIVLDNELKISDIGILKTTARGYKLKMPNRLKNPTNPEMGRKDIVHPISGNLRQIMENAVITKFKLLIGESNETP